MKAGSISVRCSKTISKLFLLNCNICIATLQRIKLYSINRHRKCHVGFFHNNFKEYKNITSPIAKIIVCRRVLTHIIVNLFRRIRDGNIIVGLCKISLDVKWKTVTTDYPIRHLLGNVALA